MTVFPLTSVCRLRPAGNRLYFSLALALALGVHSQIALAQSFGSGFLKDVTKAIEGTPDKENKKSNNNSSASKSGGLLGSLSGMLSDSGQTDKEEAAAGRAMAAKILGTTPLHGNEDLQRYINKIGRILTLNSERPELIWQFGVLDTKSVNAFAAPGGYIFITAGLLALLESEDELAAVLAHEIAHVLKKHHFNVIKQQKGIAGITSFFQSKSDSAMATNLSNMMGNVMARGLDQGAEHEADLCGVILAARAGYDVAALVKVLDKLSVHSKREAALFSLMTATHPTPEVRVDYLFQAGLEDLAEYAEDSPNAKRLGSMLQN